MRLFDFFRPKRAQPLCGSGEGKSVGTAVMINATSSLQGVRAEYEYVMKKHGDKGEDWNLESQEFMAKDGRSFDVLKIRLKSGESVVYYFDISQFFGKF